MKYLLTLLAFGLFTFAQAQSFEWNSKSVEPMPNEVQPNSPARIAYDKALNERQSGAAGVYNPNAEGMRTQYGEIYANNQLTASHALLPLGTIVRVQNLDNNRVINVRINDKGQECADCLLMLSQAAAYQLGINYRGRVSVERTGFSNWNPSSPAVQPQAYSSVPAYGGVTRPVEINQNSQLQSRGGDVAGPTTYSNGQVAYGSPVPATSAPTYNRPAAYGSPAPATGNYAVLNAPSTPSVVSREVQPAPVSREPVTYSRYPTAVSPVSAANSQPRTYQEVPRTNTYYQQPLPTQQNPAPVPQQASPPPSTVILYQESRTVPAPATYSTPVTTYNTPQAYNPQANMTARGVEAPVMRATAPVSGYVVQLGAYNNETYAQNRVDQLQKMGLGNVFYKSFQKPDGQLINRVYAGTFGSMADAQQAAKLIQGNFQIAGIVSTL